MRAWLAEPHASPIAKASALAALGGSPSRGALSWLDARDVTGDPWLRLGASLALQRAGATTSSALLAELANGGSRAVRLAVAPQLARANDAALSPEARRVRAELLADTSAGSRPMQTAAMPWSRSPT